IMSIVMLTSCIALVAACAAIITYEFFAFRSNMLLEMSTLTDITGKNCAFPLTFDHPEDAESTLANLSSEGQIQSACIYKDGKVWARYPKNLPDSALPKATVAGSHHFEKDSLRLARQVVDPAGKPIGVIFINASL